MSKLSILLALLVAFACTSSTTAQQPSATHQNPLIFAQAPEAAPGLPAPLAGPPATGDSAPGGSVPQYGAPDAPMTYAPDGPAMTMPPGPNQGYVEGHAPESYGPEGWMSDDGYAPRGGMRPLRRGFGAGAGGCDDPGCECHRGGPCRHAADYCAPRWYMRAEAVWLGRNDSPTRNLVVYDADGADPLEDTIVLGTNDLDLSSALGFRWTLGRYLNERTSIEGGFYGLHDWDDRARTALDEVNEPYNPYWGDDDESSFDISAFADSAQYVLSYDTEFDSAELGIRRWVRQDTSVLIGFRYMGLDENLSLLSRDEGSADPGARGVYEVHTENDMFGVQFGTEFVHPLWVHWLYFNFEAKAGAFLNSAKHNSTLAVTRPATNVDSRSEESIALARNAEMSIGLTLQLTDRFSLRGGYTANFINGVAIAPDQLDTTPHRFNSREYVNDDGTAILHGAYFGGEWIWH